MADEEQQKIGRFEIIRLLGSGGQGSVYLARDPTLDRFVAIKKLSPKHAALAGLADDGASLEGRIAGKLRHPNIVPVFEAGECESGPYLVFDYVEGDTLANILATRGKYSMKEAASLMVAIVGAMAQAHGDGVLHLDLGPRNIMIDADGAPRIMDFGLSQYVSRAPADRKVVVGTLSYMSPEHFSTRALGPPADVFVLGSTFYQMITGVRAIQGTVQEEIQQNLVSASVDLSVLSDIPEGEAFARFLGGAFVLQPEGRYADCHVMQEALELFLTEAGLAESTTAESSGHSTVEFLLRRMQRKQDFPAISQTLCDINRLTADEATASADKLANVILRDFALTNKLLRLVNSAFYGVRATEVTCISQAVVYLGVKQVRLTANMLSFFGRLEGGSLALKDAMTNSFLSGLIARHLVQKASLPGAEEAFICAMFQNLGEVLVIFCLTEEFEEINELRISQGMHKSAAARGVLGVSYAELGAEVARTWNFPESIIQAIRGLPPGRVATPTQSDKQRFYAVLASELCDLFQAQDPQECDVALRHLLTRFAPFLVLDLEYCLKLVGAGLGKLRENAPAFEIDLQASPYCKTVQDWLSYDRTHSTEIKTGADLPDTTVIEVQS